MILIDSIELSASTVDTQQTFTIKISVSEIMATFADLKNVTWGSINDTSWEQVKRNYLD